jgi:exonuclease SbcC
LKLTQDELIKNLQKQKAYLGENEDKKEIFNNLTLIKEQIESIEEGIDSINNYKKECDTFSAEIAKIETSEEDNNKKLQEIQQKEKSKNEEIEALQTQLKECDLELLRSRLKELDAKNTLLLELKSDVAIYETHCSGYEFKKEEIKNKLAQLEECNRKHSSACENEAKATEKFQAAETLYNKVKESGEKYLKDLRSRLSLDDNCPLCGQKIKNLLTDKDFENSIAPVREQLELSRAELDKAKKQREGEEVSLKICQTSLQQLQKELTTIENNISSTLATLNEKELWSCYKDIENRVEQLEKEITINDGERNKVAQAIDDYTTKINKINKYQYELSALKAEEDKQQKLIVENSHKIELCKTEIINRKANIEKEKTEIKDRTEEVTKVYGSNEWENEWKENPDLWLNTLTEEANRYRSVEECVRTLESEISSKKNDIENIQHSINSILELRPNWKVDVHPIKADKNIVRESSTLYANLKSISDTINSLKEQITETNLKIDKYIQENESVSFERLMELVEIGKDIQGVKKYIEDIKSETIKIDTTKATYANDLKNLETSRPEIEEGVTKQIVIEKIKDIDEEIDRVYSDIVGKKAQIKQDSENKKQHAEKLKEYEEKNNHACMWEKLSDNFGSASGAKFRKIAQSFILNNMLKQANFYLRKFTSRYEMYSQEDSLDILVRDNESAGVERPISNLSGGESFLLSLSLALGLSSISNQAMAMDTIFIDEGFGTLDSNYLNTVIDALDQLHNLNGKRVGIISHVDSLKERITTQIQVNKIGNSHSEIDVVNII